MIIESIELQLPADLSSLKAGDIVRLSGSILTGRDAAHKRLCQLLQDGKPLPIELRGRLIYYVGPCPPQPGQVIGACGPTTSGRMDSYTPQLLHAGLAGMIGKGPRSAAVIAAMREMGCVYLAATGGAGALLASCVTAARTLTFEDLGTEAIRELEVQRMPLIVAIDSQGRDLYASEPRKWRQSL